MPEPGFCMLCLSILAVREFSGTVMRTVAGDWGA